MSETQQPAAVLVRESAVIFALRGHPIQIRREIAEGQQSDIAAGETSGILLHAQQDRDA